MASQEMFPFSAADPTSMYGVESYMPDEVEDDDDAQAIGRLSGLESGSPETDARHDERDTGPFVRADAVERPVGSAPAPSGQRIRPLHADGTPHNSDVVELGPVKQISNEEVDGFKEQDRYLPIANVGRLMKKCLPDTTKVSKDAKECVQECTSEFISFITSEAADKCLDENRKTINGEDILFAMRALGFENYAEVLTIYLAKYREHLRSQGKNVKRGRKSATETADQRATAGDRDGASFDEEGQVEADEPEHVYAVDEHGHGTGDFEDLDDGQGLYEE